MKDAEIINAEKRKETLLKLEELFYSFINREIDLESFLKSRYSLLFELEKYPEFIITGYGGCSNVIFDDHLCPKDEEPSKKPKHKPFYKSINGYKLKRWEK